MITHQKVYLLVGYIYMKLYTSFSINASIFLNISCELTLFAIENFIKRLLSKGTPFGEYGGNFVRKRVSRLVLVIIFSVMSLQLSGVNSTVMAEGYGSNGKFLILIEAPAAGSIPISTRAELENIKNNLNGNYHLTADIDLSGAEWVPIGNSGLLKDCFAGVFDGQGFVISNLTITGEKYGYNGLFGCTSSATIKNVGMEGTNIDINATSGSSFYAGAICGYDGAQDISGTITNCYNTGNVSVNASAVLVSANVGGICGYSFSYNCTSYIKHCYNTGSISAYAISDGSVPVSRAGGICGDNSMYNSYSTIEDCYNSGSVTSFAHTSSANISYADAGGICGRNGYFINRCYNIGKISLSADAIRCAPAAGGISGESNRLISNSYNVGTVEVYSNQFAYAGGICGIRNDGVENCYNTGSIHGCVYSLYAMYAYVGGIYGYGDVTASVRNCYNTGDVSVTNEDYYEDVCLGGIAGLGSYAVSDCYWNIESGQAVNGIPLITGDKLGIDELESSTTALIASEMKNPLNFAGFDFADIWDCKSYMNNGYPVLKYQTPPLAPKNQNGEVVTLANISTATNLSIPVPETTSSIKPIIVFQKDERLVTAETDLQSSVTGNDLIINMNPVTIPKNISCVKILIWDSLESMQPLGSYYEIK